MYHCQSVAEERNAWDRLVPVTLQWGNDPNFTQSNFQRGEKPKETWNNQDLLSFGNHKRNNSIDMILFSHLIPPQTELTWNLSPFTISVPPAKPESRPYWGFHGRANGPADHYMSCCVSCHSTASLPVGKQVMHHREDAYNDPRHSKNGQWQVHQQLGNQSALNLEQCHTNTSYQGPTNTD